MKLFFFTIWTLALLHIVKSLPCIGDSCGRLSQLYSVYDDEDGVFYIREGSHNSASSINDDNNEQPEKEDTYKLKEPQRSNLQRLSKIYEQSVGPNTSGQESYQLNQQLYNPSTPYDENQETQHGFNNLGNYKSRNQGGSVGDFPKNNDDGTNGQYPSSGNKGAGSDHYQNNGYEYYGHYPGSNKQGGGGGDYYQNNDGYYGYYPDRDWSCPNCYATNFGNGDNNHNIINIEK